MPLRVHLADGSSVKLTEVWLYPHSLVLLADAIAEQVGVGKPELTFIGSPSWAVSGVITNAIFERFDMHTASGHLQDIRRIQKAAHDAARWLPPECFVDLDIQPIHSATALGPETDVSQIFPDQPFRGILFSKSNFAGVSHSRERKTKKALMAHAREYVVSPWLPIVRTRDFSSEHILSKDQISYVELCK